MKLSKKGKETVKKGYKVSHKECISCRLKYIKLSNRVLDLVPTSSDYLHKT